MIPFWRRFPLLRHLQEAYAGLPRGAWLLAFVQLVNMCGTMVIFFLTLYLTQRLGYSMKQAGLAMTGYGAGMLAGGLAGGTLSDHLGAFRVQRLSLMGSTGLMGVLPFLHSLPWIMAGITGLGFFAAALWPASNAAMTSLCPVEVRSKGYVLNNLAGNLGATIGPVLGGLLAQHDYRLLFFVDGGTCLLAALALLWCFPESHPANEELERPPSPPLLAWCSDRVFLVLLLTSVGVGLIFSQFFSTFGPYMRLFQGLTEAQIGRLIAVNTLLIVLFQMSIIHLTGHRSAVKVAALGCLAFALGFGLTPAGRGFGFMALSVAIWSVGEMLVMPSLTTLVSRRAPSGFTGRYLGLHSMGFSLGIAVGPPIGTRLLQAHGGTVLWLAVASCGIALALLLLGLSRVWKGWGMGETGSPEHR